MSVYGLADCNNFFVSCERVFRPALEGRPAVVLPSDGFVKLTGFTPKFR